MLSIPGKVSGGLLILPRLTPPPPNTQPPNFDTHLPTSHSPTLYISMCITLPRHSRILTADVFRCSLYGVIPPVIDVWNTWLVRSIPRYLLPKFHLNHHEFDMDFRLGNEGWPYSGGICPITTMNVKLRRVALVFEPSQSWSLCVRSSAAVTWDWQIGFCDRQLFPLEFWSDQCNHCVGNYCVFSVYLREFQVRVPDLVSFQLS